MNYDKKALQAAEKAFSESSKQVQKETKNREKAAKSILSLGDASKEASKLFSEMSKASEDSTKAVGSFTEKIDDAAKSFQKWVEEQVKRLPLGQQAIDDPVKFSFKKDIPVLGSYVRLLEGLGGAIEGALSSVVKIFTEDFAGLIGDAFSTIFDTVTQQINSNLREARRKIEGIKGIPEDLASELGPLGKYVNEDFAKGYYNFKKNYEVLPTEEGRTKIKQILDPLVRNDTADLAWQASLQAAKTGAQYGGAYANFSLNPSGFAGAWIGSMISSQLKGKT